jgi:predicted patatin/cPLA2 family phospholipase
MEHIVISSAGPNGFIQLGMLAQLMETFTIDTIQSIRGTSAGSMLAVLLCLKVPIEEVVDYFIKRPLHKWFKMDVSLFMKTNGVVSAEFIDLLAPLFHIQDIPLTITMKQLFDLSSIELHIYTTSVTNVETVDLHHSTFPDLPVMKAIAMSCAIPLLFPPVEHEGDYYIDGGLLMHCPIPPNEKTIVLYMKDKHTFSMESPFHMMSHILLKSLNRLSPPVTIGKRFEYEADIHGLDPNLWQSILTDETVRAKMIQQGKEHIQNLP